MDFLYVETDYDIHLMILEVFMDNNSKKVGIEDPLKLLKMFFGPIFLCM